MCIRDRNNLGVVKWAQGEMDDAQQRFDDALKAEPDHKEATFNAGVVIGNKEEGSAAQMDRTGAAGVVEDGRGKVDLTSAVCFASGQLLEVYRGGRWRRMNASAMSSKPFLELTFRPSRTKFFAAKQRLMVFQDGWQIGVVQRNFENEYLSLIHI